MYKGTFPVSIEVLTLIKEKIESVDIGSVNSYL
jgi:hypothetical protein